MAWQGNAYLPPGYDLLEALSDEFDWMKELNSAVQ